MQFKGKIHTQSWESRQEEEERRGGCGNLLSWLRSASLFLGDFTPASPPPPPFLATVRRAPPQPCPRRLSAVGLQTKAAGKVADGRASSGRQRLELFGGLERCEECCTKGELVCSSWRRGGGGGTSLWAAQSFARGEYSGSGAQSL